MTIISLLLLASLLPHLTFTAHVDVGIVNGKEAKPHSRPYMVSLQINGHHHCCGFLISDEFVMTAAHCQKNQVMTAVVGAHDLKNKNERSVCIGVKSYHKHPDYSNESNLNDIMLLRGDSGGPLVCGNTAVGVMSFGDRERCNSPESQTLTVVVGAHDLRLSKNSDRIGVKSYMQHPSYNRHFPWNDIMLLRLQEKVYLNNVKWISLPEKGEDVEADTHCSVAGWGRVDIKDETPNISVMTLQAHVDVGIVNGTEAKPHSRPYMVSIQTGCKHVCGGFLISDRFVMTAAHCIMKNEKLTAVVNMHDLKKKEGGVLTASE
ncbi:complement factor D-like protein [Labeo rohita]|uniref:trypsin n=1 Tax=Labeo rohita TaxID=84645 RepID=A0A498NGX5_LABRO|nr:complement factor D-like protein [Labeo rohita]